VLDAELVRPRCFRGSSPHRRYRNLLIRPGQAGRWLHFEPALPRAKWHRDWLWRLAEHEARKKSEFRSLEERGWFRIGEPVSTSRLRVAPNYAIFSREPSKTLILRRPPPVAYVNGTGRLEQWLGTPLVQQIKAKTLDLCDSDSLRTLNLYRPHPCRRFRMEKKELAVWRASLIRHVAFHGAGLSPGPTRYASKESNAAAKSR
jgi:hypothetical protein